jgi:hypothetical protein
VPGVFQGAADIVNGEILFPQSDDLIANRLFLLQGFLGYFASSEKEPPVRILPELMTEDPKTPRGVTETSGRLGRRELVDEISSQGFILAMGGVGRLNKDTGEIC